MSQTLLERLADTVDPAQRRFIEKQGEFSALLGRLLDELNITQQELADRAGLKRSYINRLLHGGGNVTLKTLTRLEIALGRDLICIPISVNARP